MIVRSIRVHIILFPALIAFACSKADGRAERGGVVYPVTSPAVIDTSDHRDYPANIHAVQKVEIRARVPGYLERIHVDEGQRVKAGQLLFTISSAQYRERLAKADALHQNAIASLEAAKLELNSVRSLAGKNVVGELELKLAENRVYAAQARVEEARADRAQAGMELSYSEIRAPFDGLINRIPYKPGSLLDVGTLLTSVTSIGEVFAYFHLSEKEYLSYVHDLGRYDAGRNAVSLLLANGEKFPYKGVVETTGGEIDPGTGSIAVRARFPNPDHILRHGSSAKVRLRQSLDSVLVIPQKATFEMQDKLYVFVVGAGNTVQMKPVEVSNRIRHLFVVASGLTPSDRIVYEGIQEIRSGDEVSTKFKPMSQILKELSGLKAAS